MKQQNETSSKRQRGYALLEYCAGAALIAGIVWVSLNAMGQELSNFLTGIGQWIQHRGQGISQ